jgi:hypothetical protein
MTQTFNKKLRKAAKNMAGERLKSFHEGAERTGASYWALWRGAEAGFFKTVYIGGRRMIPESELDRIVQYGFGGRKRRRRKDNAEAAAEVR